MSLAFRVFGLPRSGTSWVANWLTTNDSFCWHDPCEWAFPWDIEKWGEEGENRGISCTGSWVHPWPLDIPTLILWRNPLEVQQSLGRIGLPKLPRCAVKQFAELRGERVTLKDLLDPTIAEEVHNYLLPGVPFNAARHEMLVKLTVEPTPAEIGRVKEAIKKTGGLSCLG